MTTFAKLILLAGFFFSTTTLAAGVKKQVKKTKAHQCAVYVKNAKKARHLYSVNRKQATNINHKMTVLKKDQKRVPASAKMAKVLVQKQLVRMEKGKKKSVKNSLKYLEKHIQYVKAAKRTCAQNRVKKVKNQDIEKYLHIAAN